MDKNRAVFVLPMAVSPSTREYWNASGMMARVNVLIPQPASSISSAPETNILANASAENLETV